MSLVRNFSKKLTINTFKNWWFCSTSILWIKNKEQLRNFKPKMLGKLCWNYVGITRLFTCSLSIITMDRCYIVSCLLRLGTMITIMQWHNSWFRYYAFWLVDITNDRSIFMFLRFSQRFYYSNHRLSTRGDVLRLSLLNCSQTEFSIIFVYT